MGKITISGICVKMLVYRAVISGTKRLRIPRYRTTLENEVITITFGLDDIYDACNLFVFLQEETHAEADIKLEMTTY